MLGITALYSPIALQSRLEKTASQNKDKMTQKIGAGLLEYAGKIWDTADTLRGAGIKESEWPTYMMPFFALMMLESRLRRFKMERITEYEKETGVRFNSEDATHAQWLDDSAKVLFILYLCFCAQLRANIWRVMDT